MTVTVDRRTCIAPAQVSPLTGYRNYGCRCYPCSVACSEYERKKLAAMKAGTWKPFVDAAPVIAHLESLKQQGVGYERIAKAANVKVAMVVRYTNRHRERPRLIRPAAAEALLAVTAHAAVSAGRLVPAMGIRRRAQALAAIGWSLMDQAQRVGTLRSTYRTTLDHDRVHVTFARAVTDLYEQLSGTPGPSMQARRHAQRRGWPPPLAWDDDIDLPDAQPSGMPLAAAA